MSYLCVITIRTLGGIYLNNEPVIRGYARVSTKSQASDGSSLESQEKQLRDAGATVIYKDVFTGTVTNRPEFEKLKNELKRGDTLIVCKLDRFARTATEGTVIIQELIKQGIKVHVLNMGMIDDTPTGKLIIMIMLAFAEFERDMIVERTQAGRHNTGNYGGRPCVYSKKQKAHAMELLGQGYSYREVESMTGMSKSTLYRMGK